MAHNQPAPSLVLLDRLLIMPAVKN